MNKDQQSQKKFLEEQINWCKEQHRILEEIELRLHKMKRIAELVIKHELTPTEIDGLNSQIKNLEIEVHFLERQLYGVVH
jgi:polyhydroxyalkanoate synthesis regulator phasin